MTFTFIVGGVALPLVICDSRSVSPTIYTLPVLRKIIIALLSYHRRYVTFVSSCQQNLSILSDTETLLKYQIFFF